MKFRLGHVTNSSSSSFICEACGDVEGGFDMSLKEAEMSECENGHTFCNYHLTNIIGDMVFDEKHRGKLIDFAEECLSKVTAPELFEEKIAQLKTETSVEEIYNILSQIADDELTCETPDFLCPLCMFEELDSGVLLRFFIKEYYEDDEEKLKNDLKARFNSFKDLVKYIK